MSILQIIIDNPETIQKQIKQLRDLVINYHFTEEPWTKTWMSVIIPSVVVAISIVGQLFIFRLNKNKEIKIKVAELYGKFKSKSILYTMTLWEFNGFHIYHLRNKHLQKKYYAIISAEDYSYTSQNEYSEIDCNALENQYRNETEEYFKKYNEHYKKHKDEKLELLEILNQIHFYYNDKTLDEYIEAFRVITLIPIEIEEYKKDLENKKFFENIYQQRVTGQMDDCKNLFNRITKRMLKLS